MACPVCDNAFKDNTLYENDKIKVMLAIDPSVEGHIQIFTTKHYSILEELPADLIGYISGAANKISILLFELLKVHGTNIIIQNGVPAGQSLPHFSVHIIPRRTDDNMKLDWDMKQASAESLDSMQRIIAEGMDGSSNNEIIQTAEEMPADTTPHDLSNDEQDTAIIENTKEKKVNYFLKSLERIP